MVCWYDLFLVKSPRARAPYWHLDKFLINVIELHVSIVQHLCLFLQINYLTLINLMVVWFRMAQTTRGLYLEAGDVRDCVLILKFFQVLEQVHSTLNAEDSALEYVETLCLRLLAMLCAVPPPLTVQVLFVLS